MFWTVFILSVGILGIGLLLMSVQIIFGKRKSFPDYRIGHNPELRKRNIYCARTEQRIIDGMAADGDACSSCI